MRVDFARLDELHGHLLAAQRLAAISLHVIDDDIRHHLALTLLEPELARLCAIANRMILDLRRPELAVAEP